MIIPGEPTLMTRDDLDTIAEAIRSDYETFPRHYGQMVAVDPAREDQMRQWLDLFKLGMDNITLNEDEIDNCKQFYNAAHANWESTQEFLSRYLPG